MKNNTRVTRCVTKRNYSSFGVKKKREYIRKGLKLVNKRLAVLCSVHHLHKMNAHSQCGWKRMAERAKYVCLYSFFDCLLVWLSASRFMCVFVLAKTLFATPSKCLRFVCSVLCKQSTKYINTHTHTKYKHNEHGFVSLRPRTSCKTQVADKYYGYWILKTCDLLCSSTHTHSLSLYRLCNLVRLHKEKRKQIRYSYCRNVYRHFIYQPLSAMTARKKRKKQPRLVTVYQNKIAWKIVYSKPSLYLSCIASTVYIRQKISSARFHHYVFRLRFSWTVWLVVVCARVCALLSLSFLAQHSIGKMHFGFVRLSVGWNFVCREQQT